MTESIQFETERLWLRQWQPGDRTGFAELNADPDVMRYLPKRLNRQESDALAERCAALIAERGWGLWAVEAKAGPFIGFVGLHVPVYALPFQPCVEIGWRLSRKYWGKGLATEAARACLQVGFDTLGLPEIVSFTSVANMKSQAVMARLGMGKDPQTFIHPALAADSALALHCLYRLSDRQWREQNAEPDLA